MAADLVIRISGDLASFEKSLEDAQGQTEALDNRLADVAKVAAVAFAALTAEVYTAVAAYGEQEQATNRLNNAMKQQGVYSEVLAKRYDAIAQSLQDKTGIDGDAIRSGTALLQNMVGQKEITDELIASVVDLAEEKEMSLASAFELVGKAANGNAGALSKYGVEVQLVGDRTKDMATITKGLTGAFGGAAEATGKGIGSFRGLKSAFEDVQEEIGKRFAPAVTAVTRYLTEFFKAIASSDSLTGFAAAIVAGGIALSGFVGVLAITGIALNAATAYATAFGVSLSVALGPIGLVAIAVGALAAALGYMAINAANTKSPMALVEEQIKKTEKELKNFQETASATPQSSDYYKGLQFNIDLTREKLERLRIQQDDLRKSETRAPLNTQEQAQRDAANKLEAEKTAQERRQREAQQTHLRLLTFQLEKHNERTVELAQQEAELTSAIADQKNVSIRTQLEQELGIIRQMKQQEIDNEAIQQQTLNADILAKNEEFQALTEAQKAEFMEKNLVTLRQGIMTEDQIRKQATLDRANAQILEHNEFLKNQQKYGTAYALINKIMHSEIYQGSKQAFGELSALQSSSNSTLKGIGKAAAVANIAIKTAESAMNIYAGFSTIPIIGPALGIAGAAAAVAFGVEQAGKVTAAADGGLLTGGIAGRDSIPVLGMPGELVVPTRNFDEVVNATAASRNGGSPDGGGGGGTAHIVIELRDQLVEMVEMKIVERQNLGISLLGAS